MAAASTDNSNVLGPALVPVEQHAGKAPIRLTRPVYVIGSRSTARLQLLSSSVSKAHALLVRSNGRTYLRDLASRTKVFINGSEAREADLDDGDLIKIGTFTFRYIGGPEEERIRPARPAMNSKLDVVGSDYPVPIEQRVLLIGRRSICDVALVEASVSTAHAVIFEMDGERYVRDLGSRSGTLVNGVQTHQHQLVSGDVVRIGETEMRYLPNEMAPAEIMEEADSGQEIPSLLETPETHTAVEPPPLAPQEEMVAPPPVEAAAVPLPIEEPPPVEEVAPAIPKSLGEPPRLLAPEVPAEPPPIPVAPEAPAIVEPAPRAGEPLSIADVFKAMPPAPVEPLAEAFEEPPLPPPVTETGELNLEVPALDFAEPHAAAQSEIEQPPLDLSAAADEPPPVEPQVEPTEVVLDFSSPEPEPEPQALSPEPIEPLADVPVDADEPILLESESFAPAIEETPVAAEPEPAAEAEAPIEVIEPTQPTPQSALEPAAEALSAEPSPAPEPAAPRPDEMTDTSFGRAVREFAGDEIGEIVEPPAPEPEPVAEAPREEPEAVEASASQETDEAPIFPAPDMVTRGPELAVPPPIDLEPPPMPKEDEFAIPELKLPQVQFPPLAEPKTSEPQKLEPVADILKVPPPPPTRSPIPGAAAPPRAPVPMGRMGWGANQENFLGGVPIDLKKGGGPAQSGPSKSPLSETPIGEKAVKDLIDKIDHVAAAAEAASTAPPPKPPAADEFSPLIASLPPRPRRGTFSQGSRPGAIESIPPMEPDRPKRDTITTGFDGLAMSPLAQMDAFSHTAPPGEFGLLGGAGGMSMPAEPVIDKVSEPIANEFPSAPAKPERGLPRRQVPPMPSRVQAVPESMPPVMPPELPKASPPPAPEPELSSPPPAAPPEIPQFEDLMPPMDEVPPPVDQLPPAPAPEIPPARPAPVAEMRSAVTFADESPDTATIRKKYIRRVSVLVALMVLACAAAMYCISNFVRVPSTVEGKVTYLNVATLNNRDRGLFQQNQLRLLKEESTQQSAKRLIPAPRRGFLDRREDYFAIAEAATFSETKPDVLSIKIEGSDGSGDQARMTAMLQAMYDANQWLITDASRARRSFDDVQRRIENDQKEVKRLGDEIERLRRLDDARPGADDIKKLEGEVAELEKKWGDAMKSLKDAQTEMENSKVVPAANAIAVADDALLKSMQGQLQQLQGKLNASRSASADRTADARKQLDATFEAFQKQIADAQAAASGNPEAAAYVKAAADLQEKTRQLTDDLMRRQEQQFGSLMELKERLNEQMETRRAQLWSSDPQLQQLTEHLNLLTRQYNAAVGGGLQKEANDKKAEIETTKAQVKARQDSLPGDKLFGEAIQQLQTIIDSTRKNIAEDRAKTDQLLTTLQQGFTSSQETKKLPQDQQQVAEKMRLQLAQINEARRQYNVAVDAADADSDAQTRQQIASLQANIDARRKQLAQAEMERKTAASNPTALEGKQQAIATLTDAEKTAREALFAKHKLLRDAQTAVDESKQNAETLDRLIREKDVEDRNLKTDLADVENRKKQADEAVEPVKPDPNHDIAVTTGEDRRVLYMAVASGVIVAVFFMMILWTLHTAALETPYAMTDDMEMPPLSGIEVQPARPGSTERTEAHSDDDTDEDQQPAII